MAKDSYFRKHKEKIHGPAVQDEQRIPFIKISDEKRKVFEDGQVILIDKPLHWTSFDVVRKIRNAIGIKKVGHAGTLDPLATGLLIVCTGKFTKRINEFMAQEKEYTGTITFGAVTPTYDMESEPVDFKSVEGINLENVSKAAGSFVGNILQKPPIYSAIKKNGTSLYELARRGEDVELLPRPVTIREFEITSFELPVITFRIVCSTGTYIRSVAHDIGQLLGCGAYLSSLRRTRIGDHNVQTAVSMTDFIAKLEQDSPKKDN